MADVCRNLTPPWLAGRVDDMGKTEEGDKVYREHGHSFKLVRPNVTGPCVDCGVEVVMLSEVPDWDGKDQFRVWKFPDGTWRKYGQKTGRSKTGERIERETGIPPCTVVREKSPEMQLRLLKMQAARKAKAGVTSGSEVQP